MPARRSGGTSPTEIDKILRVFLETATNPARRANYSSSRMKCESAQRNAYGARSDREPIIARTDTTHTNGDRYDNRSTRSSLTSDQGENGINLSIDRMYEWNLLYIQHKYIKRSRFNIYIIYIKCYIV